MDKIKSYQRKDRLPRLMPNDRLENAELYCDGICYDISGMSLREMEVNHLQEIEKSITASLYFCDTEKMRYDYDHKKRMWFLIEEGE